MLEHPSQVITLAFIYQESWYKVQNHTVKDSGRSASLCKCKVSTHKAGPVVRCYHMPFMGKGAYTQILVCARLINDVSYVMYTVSQL